MVLIMIYLCFIAKNRFQLEIPDSASKNTPDEYSLQSQKKGFRRYWTPEIQEQLATLTAAEDRRDTALKDTMRTIFEQFDTQYVCTTVFILCCFIFALFVVIWICLLLFLDFTCLYLFLLYLLFCYMSFSCFCGSLFVLFVSICF